MRLWRAATLLILVACSGGRNQQQMLFTDVAAKSGITFRNDLEFTERLNPYTYRNFYNGAGVAVGDINNDGLHDIYFAANQAGNRLYLNKGNFSFEDITAKAQVGEEGAWSTGVSFVDINADGLLDIYVCKSGDPDSPKRSNALLVNNGDLTFTDKAREYGLDVKAMSVQAAFFDYDRDGDLDCYLLSNSMRVVGQYDLVKDQRNVPDPQGGGNKFFLNKDGKFVDFSAEAGIYRSNIGFGLGITLGDFNEDSWTDIFISNDFFERDYLYLNNQDGTFRESLTDYFGSISMGSMGADFADLDGDGSPELFVTEMLPDSLSRKKTKTVYEGWDKYSLNAESGYHYQVPRNVLHKKVGDSYVEVGRMAGVAASEWSWGALLFDMDNDGRRDIFIANGIMRDLLDRDYLAYTGSEDNVRRLIRTEKNPILKLIELMPSTVVPNYAYRNQGGLRFENYSSQWGLDLPVFSTGSAYGDFDNDGDLDLVVNNQDAPASLYRNNSDSVRLKSISITLSQPGDNTRAVGSEVTIFSNGKSYSADNFITRGFQSSVSGEIHFGLGETVQKVDSILITWPDRRDTWLYDLATNSDLRIDRSDVTVSESEVKRTSSTGRLPFCLQPVPFNGFRHRGNNFIDFNRDRLLPMMYSNEAPALVTGDLNNDGIDEVYVGGGKDQGGAVITMTSAGWVATTPRALRDFTMQEETAAALFDIDGDHDSDLYMASGGRFYPKESSLLMDQLFINNGNGELTVSTERLPFPGNVSTSFVKTSDFDHNKGIDLVVGERFDPFTYGRGGRAYLFEGDGTGKFKDVTEQRAPQLATIGMATDAVITDINDDSWQDIVIVGDWMPLKAFKNTNGTLVDISTELGLNDTEGWWHDIETQDLNGDHRPDFIGANHGLNTFFKAGDRMYVGDFDGNGSIEQIFCTRIDGKYYPVNDRDELISQLPGLKKTLLYYRDYAKMSIDNLFSEDVLQKAKVVEVKTLTSSMWLSGPGGYVRTELPQEAQYSPLYALLIDDVNQDGVPDLVAGGNQYQVKPQFGRYDASQGWFFKGVMTNGTYSLERGIALGVKGQIRDIKMLAALGEKYLFFAKYDDELEIRRVVKCLN